MFCCLCVVTNVTPLPRFIEAITDPKAYIFMVFVALANFIGGVGVQYSLIIKDFGFDTLQTTLLNIPAGACQVFIVTFSMWLLHKYPVRFVSLRGIAICTDVGCLIECTRMDLGLDLCPLYPRCYVAHCSS